MKIKKTVGNPKLDMFVKGKHRKGYVIHTTCGHKYHAKPVGPQSYECGGNQWKSLKALKAHIEDDGFADDDNEPAETSTADGADTWDCVHPCALLILGVDPRCPNPEDFMETLGNYGWLDVMGRPDIARAEREIKRVKNLKLNAESFQDTEPSGE